MGEDVARARFEGRTDYLAASGLNIYLDKLKFNLVGYGCTTCIGNSGPLPEAIGAAIKENNLVAVAVLSAIATSRDAFILSFARIIWHRRRSSSRMRSRDAWTSI